jgi:hypothetical protein
LQDFSFADSSYTRDSLVDEDENESDESSKSQAPKEPVKLLPKKKKVTGPVAVMAEAVSVLAQLKQRKPSPQIVATPKTAFEQEVDEDFAFGRYLVLELKKVKNQRVKNQLKLKLQSLIFDAQSDDTNANARQNVSDEHAPNYNRPYPTNSHISVFRSTQLYNPYEIEPQLIDDSGSSGRSTTSSPYSNTFTMTQM